MKQDESGRVAIILGVFVLILLGLAAYVVMSFDDAVDPRDRYAQDRGKAVVEGESFGPLPYDRRGKTPAVFIDRVLKGEDSEADRLTPIARFSGSLVAIVKQDWESGDLKYRRHRLDRDRLEALIVALLAGAENPQGDYRVSLRAPDREARSFSMPKSALQPLVARGLGDADAREAELVGYQLKAEVLPRGPDSTPELSPWPLRGIRLDDLVTKGALLLSSPRDLGRAARHLALESSWVEDEKRYRVLTQPLLTRWDRDQAR